MMMNLLARLYAEEHGFVISGEVVLVGTITVLGMVVGLSEVAFNINRELGDVANAFGSVNQNYHFQGTNGEGSVFSGSQNSQSHSGGDVICDIPATGESY